jgi:NAD(P)-dependent dehydrogenase (short-subunit alcohol dehydrogenase family)
MDRLRQKSAIVTGGANGIGRAISELFAEEGARVVVADIETEAGNNVVAEIVRKGGNAVFCQADVGSPEDAARIATTAAGSTGRIDVLCNNAAYLTDWHAILEVTAEEWERAIRVNLMGAHYVTKEVLPYMIRQKQGSIVNIASMQALVGCPTSVAYTSMKAALVGFTLSAACDYGPYNVRVNALCPGPIQTRISPKPGEPHYRVQCDRTMLGRVAYPREAAYPAVFLASDEASFVTGAVIPVDGGWTAKW